MWASKARHFPETIAGTLEPKEQIPYDDPACDPLAKPVPPLRLACGAMVIPKRQVGPARDASVWWNLQALFEALKLNGTRVAVPPFFLSRD